MATAAGMVAMMTDFGLRDGYVGAMKGIMLKINPRIRWVDVGHQIKRHDIVSAALMLSHICDHFPQGCVHLAVVDPGVGSDRRALVVETADYFFVGPDNGILEPVLEKHTPVGLVSIEDSPFLPPERSDTFHGRDVFAPVAAHCASGVPVKRFGRPVRDYQRLDIPRPHHADQTLEGQVVAVDHFGNLVTNISRQDLERFSKGSGVFVLAGAARIEKISRSYSQVAQGSPLAIFNSWDHLEVAVNGADACQVLGLGMGGAVMVRRLAGG
jgi:hypothetical protein